MMCVDCLQKVWPPYLWPDKVTDVTQIGVYTHDFTSEFSLRSSFNDDLCWIINNPTIAVNVLLSHCITVGHNHR